MNVSILNRLGFNRRKTLKKLENLIDEINPDIIHAHNISMAELASRTDVPFIHDDHELWSQYLKYVHRPTLKGHLVKTWLRLLYTKWEKMIGKKYPILVPSQGIVDFYKEHYDTPYVFKFPNMPPLEEVKNTKLKKPDKKSLITVAIGVKTTVKTEYRRIDDFIDLFYNNDIGKLMIIGQDSLKSDEKIISLGTIPHYNCYTEASRGHVGIIPFKPHPYHEFSGANKAYLYIHSGLVLVTPDSQKEFHKITDEMGVGYHFKKYSDLKKYLETNKEDLKSLDRKRIIKIARKKFVLDNYLENLNKAYKIATEINS